MILPKSQYRAHYEEFNMNLHVELDTMKLVAPLLVLMLAATLYWSGISLSFCMYGEANDIQHLCTESSRWNDIALILGIYAIGSFALLAIRYLKRSSKKTFGAIHMNKPRIVFTVIAMLLIAGIVYLHDNSLSYCNYEDSLARRFCASAADGFTLSLVFGLYAVVNAFRGALHYLKRP